MGDKSNLLQIICKDYLPTYVVVYGESLVNRYVNELSQNSHHHQMIIQIIYYHWTSIFYFCTNEGIIKCIASILTASFTNENQWKAEQAILKLPTILQLNDWQSRKDTQDLLFSKPLIGIYPCTSCII